jgi:hypothetical protein
MIIKLLNKFGLFTESQVHDMISYAAIAAVKTVLESLENCNIAAVEINGQTIEIKTEKKELH